MAEAIAAFFKLGMVVLQGAAFGGMYHFFGTPPTAPAAQRAS
jgi:hypothetical protein